MRTTDVVIVGGGQAGLAMSRCLSDLRIEHVVLERGQVGERWRSERWNSLRLLTPNWMTRLPGFQYDGPDPDGFMTSGELVNLFEQYAHSFRAPVETGTVVDAIERDSPGPTTSAKATVVRRSLARRRKTWPTFHVSTSRGVWHARNVVIATGHADRPLVPAMATALDGSVHQMVPSEYRNAAALPEGGVLVVGASATGVQLADEIQASGRQVVLSVGHHLRVPRIYRGRDIMWWLDRTGILDETEDSVYDLEISRNMPSFQLVGRPDHSTLNLETLRRAGVLIVGRLKSVDGHRLRFDDDLVKTTVAADVKLASLLSRLDSAAERSDLGELVDAPEQFEPLWSSFTEAPIDLDLKSSGINTVVWATGYRRDYSWLNMPLLDAHGELRHHHGITPLDGVYTMGMRFQRTRRSTFIDGVGADARIVAQHIAARLKPGRGSGSDDANGAAIGSELLVVGQQSGRFAERLSDKQSIERVTVEIGQRSQPRSVCAGDRKLHETRFTRGPQQFRKLNPEVLAAKPALDRDLPHAGRAVEDDIAGIAEESTNLGRELSTGSHRPQKDVRVDQQAHGRN